MTEDEFDEHVDTLVGKAIAHLKTHPVLYSISCAVLAALAILVPGLGG